MHGRQGDRVSEVNPQAELFRERIPDTSRIGHAQIGKTTDEFRTVEMCTRQHSRHMQVQSELKNRENRFRATNDMHLLHAHLCRPCFSEFEPPLATLSATISWQK
jgi:hypothetical protein